MLASIGCDATGVTASRREHPVERVKGHLRNGRCPFTLTGRLPALRGEGDLSLHHQGSTGYRRPTSTADLLLGLLNALFDGIAAIGE